MIRSVGALIVDSHNRLLLQKRDDKRSIYFPGLWGVFGGACESNESPQVAIAREIREELAVEIGDAELFLKLQIESPLLGTEPRERYFFTAYFAPDVVDRITLLEGAEYGFFSVSNLPHISELVPFDVAAVVTFVHARQIGSQIVPAQAICA
jgi:ADP-ribose pyrophosphatase YjhB (NUDIX family)